MGRDGSWRARLVVGARLVSSRTALDLPGLARLSHQPRDHRSRQPAAHNSIGFLDRASGFRVDGRHGRLRPQQRARTRLHRVARRSHARLRRHHRLRTCRAGRSRDGRVALRHPRVRRRHQSARARRRGWRERGRRVHDRRTSNDRAAIRLGPRGRRRRHRLCVPRRSSSLSTATIRCPSTSSSGCAHPRRWAG